MLRETHIHYLLFVYYRENDDSKSENNNEISVKNEDKTDTSEINLVTSNGFKLLKKLNIGKKAFQKKTVDEFEVV